jgi:aspartyl-tRNA(Asn)/glutamyl-tRNA(Gln) amidotransferase subunit A
MHDLSAFELAGKIRKGEISAREAVSNCLQRIETAQPALNAFLSLDGERALAQAKHADEADQGKAGGRLIGPLTGVPMALKDNICTAFGSTTAGSKILAPFRSGYNAHVAQRLTAAGAIIVGKTNCDEFAMGSSTENSGFGPSRNPWDRQRVPGGSSGGSAAAVAARLIPAALGSDTGGSIRQPASFCGVVGMKPSYGRVSRFGLITYGSSLDVIGPITRDVRDAALLLSVIAGHDAQDSTCAAEPVPDYMAALNRPFKGVRLGIAEEYFGEGLDTTVREAVLRAIDILKAAGAEVVPIHLPHMRFGIATYYLIATAEASSNLARFDGIRYGHRAVPPTDINDLYARSRGEAFGAEVKLRIMLGTYALSSGYYDQYYVKALKVRTLIRRDFEQAFDRVDAIVSPVAPTTAFRLGEKCDDPLAMYLSDVYTIAANLAGVCAISVPCGFDGKGLPIGMQLMGRAFGEEQLLSIAHHYQQLTDYHRASPRVAG